MTSEPNSVTTALWPPQALWMHDLGWDSYWASMLWSKCSIMRVLEFSSLSMALAQGSLKWLEMGLGIIDNILSNYILNASNEACER